MSEVEQRLAVPPEEVADCQTQVERILSSSTFQTSPLLRQFLEFITRESLAGRSDGISEYSIATQALGRHEDFDPTSAAVVRTQAYRLRRKLAEYYSGEGAGDSIVVEIPKGHYQPVFSRRSVAAEAAESLAAAESPAARAVPSRRLWAAGVVLFLAGIMAGAAFVRHRSSPGLEGLPKGQLTVFWKAFAQRNRPVVVAFTNPIFLANEAGDLFQARGILSGVRGESVKAERREKTRAREQGALYFEDSFTGTGEVFAMHRLTSLMERLGVPIVVKRNRTITVEDLRHHDVIFLGSGRAVETMQNQNLLRRFQFELLPKTHSPWRMGIRDRSADAALPLQYRVEQDPQTRVLKTDYAVFAVVPGVVPESRVVMLTGLTTTGTQGAADFATDGEQLARLAAMLKGTRETTVGFPPYFEALLRIDVSRGIDAAKTRIVAATAVGAGESPGRR